MFIGLKSKALSRVRETALQEDVTGLHISWSNDQGWPLASSVVGLGSVGGTGPLSSGTTSSPWSLWSPVKSILGVWSINYTKVTIYAYKQPIPSAYVHTHPFKQLTVNSIFTKL